MRSLQWDRDAVIEELRDQLWLHVSPTATRHDTALHAAALLQLPYSDVERLGALHFVLDPAVKALLDDGPALLRRQASDTRTVTEISTDRVRGPVDWPATARRRALDRTPVVVTHPRHRDSDVQPNQTLALVLQAARDVETGLTGSAERPHAMSWLAADIQRRAAALAGHRALMEVTPRPPSARDLVAMRAPRVRRRHAILLDAWQAYDSLIRQVDAHAVRAVVEQRGFAVAENGALFELLVLFRVRAVLDDAGWAVQRARVFGGNLRFSAMRGEEVLDVWYQGVPAELRRTSAYVAAQRAHLLPGAADLRPDLVLALRRPDRPPTWLIVEAKTTHDRASVPVLARRALNDLLAYRSAYAEHLHGHQIWGLGVVWGEGLAAATDHEVGLCTPDTLADAVANFTESSG